MPPIVKRSSPNSTTKQPTPISASSSADVWGGSEGIRLLLYGESGTGKTTFWATFPAPILVLICSGGSKPGELRSVDTPENRKRIVPKIVKDTSTASGLLDNAANYGTVVLDHASGFADLCLKEILGLDELPAQKRWGLASQQQYGQMALQCKEFFRRMLNLTSNVVIVAQQRTFGGKEDGGDPEVLKPTVGASLTPSLTGWLNPACDFVLQTFKRPKMVEVVTQIGGKDHVTFQRGKGVDYCLRCEPHDIFQTKFRLPKGRELPDAIVDPDYDKLMAIING